MAAEPGFNLLVRVRVQDTGDFDEVPCRSISLDEQSIKLPRNKFGNVTAGRAFMDAIKGVESGTLSLVCDFDPGDGGFDHLHDDGFESGSALELELLWDGVNGREYPIKVFGRSLPIEFEGDQVMTFSCEICGGIPVDTAY